MEYSEVELKAFQEFLNDNEDLKIESLKRAYVKNAKSLDITYSYEGKIKNLDSLKDWTFLEEIAIDINSINNVDSLQYLPNLEKVFIRNVDNNKLKAIGKCYNLKTLELVGDITDISFIEGLTKLQDLGIQKNKRLTDISALKNMKELKRLDVYETAVSDISVMKNLESLEEVLLNDTNVSDVSALSGLKNLHSIFLANTKVKDISMLANLPKLEMLNVYNTDVEDVSAFVLTGKLNTIGIEKKKLPKIEKKNIPKEISKLKKIIFQEKVRLNDLALEKDIDNFEEEFNIKLPENYRSFIKEVGNGLTKFDEEGNEIISFMPLEKCKFDKKGVSKRFKYKDAWFWEEDETATDRKINNALVNGSICLADTGCGTAYHLIVNGPSTGQVWMFTGEGVTPFDTCTDFLDWVNAIIEGRIE